MTYLFPLLTRRYPLQATTLLRATTAVAVPSSYFVSRQVSTTTSDKFKPWHPLPRMMDSKTKLGVLRELMTAKRLDAYIVPSEDDRSAGRALVTDSEALLWTDGRYFLQAGKELDPKCWTLMKAGLPDTLTLAELLKERFPRGDVARVGIDPKVVTYEGAKMLREQLQPKEDVGKDGAGASSSGRELVPVQENLVDQVWTHDLTPDGSGGKPDRSVSDVFVLEEKYTGRSTQEKLAQLRQAMGKANSPGVVVSMLDEVAWLFNLRGSDIIYNPVFFSYAIVTSTECSLYVRPAAISADVRKYLSENGVSVKPYDSVWPDLQALGKEVAAALADSNSASRGNKTTKPKSGEQKVEDILRKIENCEGKIMIGSHTSWAVALALGEGNIVIRPSPIEDAKALKNSVELDGMRRCHIRDGAALARYFAWLEEQLQSGTRLTEFEGATKLEEYRSPTEDNCAVIDKDQMYLCDSGGQYLDGTTDVTRTFHFGTPSDREIRAFTRVLQGVIAIDTCVFPKDTKGGAIDALARLALWQDGLDFRHSVGHGVGSFLNVHEGPVYIGMPSPRTEVGMREGLVISNEPGYYEDGAFGIRTENLVMVVKADTPNVFGGQPYLKFENLTMCPVQVSLIDVNLLAPKEKEWINKYHGEVLQKVRPLLEEVNDTRAVQWLERIPPRAKAKVSGLFTPQALLSPRHQTSNPPSKSNRAFRDEQVKMLISKENRKAIYEALFKEGVMVAEKNFNAPSHADLPQIRNLEVIKAMQSLTSKGFVKTRFSWQWYYYTLTPEGLDYLREYLHLPSEIVPQTHKKPARPAAPAGRAPRGDGAYRAPRGGDREGYRRREDGEGKEGASGDFRPRFGGVGRGAPLS
ncbi:hypothetical protein QFC24_006496 [Naganishia onofrii]|uniref:Uncharacterized protein n=1 Tax=Naganishia onofrii TaxID=1851511 RepID=A0ACC2X031_9TREE|nr:hypothetical protein QFC24_006496 [Naganishia onofrii]